MKTSFDMIKTNTLEKGICPLTKHLSMYQKRITKGTQTITGMNNLVQKISTDKCNYGYILGTAGG